VVAEFPAESHTPITYPGAIIAGRGEDQGRGFLDFLASPDARSVFESAGFGLP
jgi:molybdate transport system substrate-binding protein